MKPSTRFLCTLIGYAFLAACSGGGGGGGGAPVIVPPPLSNDSGLTGLTLVGVEFDQIFQSSLTGYTATVSLLKSTTTVTATLADSNATMTVNGTAVDTGAASDKISLDHGDNIITVTVTAEDGVTITTYTITVTRETVANFAQRAYIKASNTDDNDHFGESVAFSGDTLAVAAWYEDSATTGIDGDQADNSAEGAGAVYVFTRDPAGVWSQQAYIKASNTDANDDFGYSVALSGDTLAVSAPSEASAAPGIDGDQGDNSLFGAGAVYVFTRDAAGTWSQQAYVKASNNEFIDEFQYGDGFGYSVALSGDTLAVGAPGEESLATGIDGDQSDDNATFSGAVYVFTRDGAGAWSQQAYVKASNTDAGDRFGMSLALSGEGDTLVVGAKYEDSAATGIDGDQGDNSAPSAGAAYVFTRDATGTWSQQAYVKASNTDAGDRFGMSLALSGEGDTLVVGAKYEDSAATGIDGDQGDNSAPSAGAAYVFTRDATGTWSQQAYVKASNTDAYDYLGYSVAILGETLAVGAPGEESLATGIDGDQGDDSAYRAGAVYLFTRDGAGTWSQLAYVKASNTDVADDFGLSAALSGDTLAVGARDEGSAATGIDGDQSDNSSTYSGAVYVFE